jgi:hypothetical protein
MTGVNIHIDVNLLYVYACISFLVYMFNQIPPALPVPFNMPRAIRSETSRPSSRSTLFFLIFPLNNQEIKNKFKAHSLKIEIKKQINLFHNIQTFMFSSLISLSLSFLRSCRNLSRCCLATLSSLVSP